MADQVPIRYIRIASKERPSDRFLTAQIREASREQEEIGDLYLLVEINNPWFPNAQIGQTIINTLVREYRRGQSTSVLVNFELALRKTNAVLAQITQNGETDWIGNLSSLILLVNEEHIHLAQTGSAEAYLLRSGKLSSITDGLAEEAGLHPLTTYTNITTGRLEPGDIVILASRDIAHNLPSPALAEIFRADSLREAGRELVRRLQKKHSLGANAFLIQSSAPATSQPETIYIDASLWTPTEVLRRSLTHYLGPALTRSSQGLQHGRRTAVSWTRDWLVPRMISWTKASQAALRQATGRLQPHLQKTLAKPLTKFRARAALWQSQRAGPVNETVPLVGQTIYRVHHYDEGQKRMPRKFRQFWENERRVTPGRGNGFWEQERRRLAAFLKGLASINIPGTRKQRLLLALALVSVLVVIVSASGRRVQQKEEVKDTAAAGALVAAQAAQAAAERAFLLDQKTVAIEQFLEATKQATLAATTEATKADALEILSRSQSILDTLTGVSRFAPVTPLASLPATPILISKIGNEIIAVSQDRQLVALKTGENGARLINLPIQGPGQSQTVLLESWYLATTNEELVRYRPDVGEAQLMATNWPAAAGLAAFGTNIYGLDPAHSQIWKYPLKGDVLGNQAPYLKEADAEHLAGAKSLAIDGEVFVLLADGTVAKYSRGVRDAAWQLHDLPSPHTTITKPRFLTTNADSERIYLLEDRASPDQPGRLIEFDKTGAYIRQLVFAVDWTNQAVWFDPVQKTGLVAIDQKVFEFAFPSN